MLYYKLQIYYIYLYIAKFISPSYAAWIDMQMKKRTLMQEVLSVFD